MKKFLLLTAILVLAFTWACDDPGDTGDTALPQRDITVSGPITGGNFGMPWMTAWEDLESRDYVEEEFFIEGEATRYAVQGRIKSSGEWDMTEIDKQPYKTRILVRRPKKAENFNGTVVVEWFNVSGMVDAGPGWMFNEPMLTREGFAWVGVDAQKQGADGIPVAAFLKPLNKWDPERYGTLHHPGDNYAYDIFSQAGMVVKGLGSAPVLGDLEVKKVIAYGESQSAGTLTTYTNALQNIHHVYDGLFIHSRFSMANPLVSPDTKFRDLLGLVATHIRTDINVPVMQFQTETDASGYIQARQDDTDMIRSWEVPGTAHADYYLAWTIMEPEVPENQPKGVNIFYCEAGNRGPQYAVLRKALKGLDEWIKGGEAPAKAPRIATEGMKILKDEFGNAKGGIRHPYVDVPVAMYTTGPYFEEGAERKLADMACGIFGGTAWFSDEELAALYPSQADYVSKFTASAQEMLSEGFILPEEANEMIEGEH